MPKLVTPALVIPAELKPADGRFGSGPARIRPAQLAALAGSGPAYLGTSHRQPPVRSLVRRVPGGPGQLLRLPARHTRAPRHGRPPAFLGMAPVGVIRRAPH